ncbi:MAG TPA: DUF2231 domain-containing protein [Nocardioidaceae bacterium]|nr:DUF2231 domain-containing protein [Nocardioidaceae bacterium]
MEIFGLPVHVLVVHGAVVFTPLAALATIVFALRPQWRYLSRWPAVLLALAATGSVWMARLSGEDLQEARSLPDQLIATHESRGEVLALVMIVFLVLTLLGARLLGGPSGLASGRGAVAVREGWVEKVVPLALVAISVVALVYVVLTGDAGARATWG